MTLAGGRPKLDLHPYVRRLLAHLPGQAARELEGALMSNEKQLRESYQKLIAGAEIAPEEERAILEHIARSDPTSLPQLSLLLANQKRDAQGELVKAREARLRAEAALAAMREPPLFPAEVLQVHASRRIEVMVSGRRQLVVAAPELPAGDLRAGDEVLLDRELIAAVDRNPTPRRTGTVGTVVETGGGFVILQGAGDEETVAACAPELATTLQAGDRVLYRRDTQCAFARLGARTHSPHLLAEPPAVRFSDIGGLDDVIGAIRGDVDLHLLHPEIVAAYGLRLMRGFLLVGRPGIGKTMIAAAVASYLAETRPETRFLHVKPGALRAMYYGESEARIRELFALARRATGLVVVFFDELDNFGARGNGLGQQIDDRVMAALLAEIDGLASADNVLCIGATNRLDLCDEALVRQGRFGDRIYRLPRPGREATRQILSRYLTPAVPYTGGGEPQAQCTAIVEAAVGHLFAARDGAGSIATVTLVHGARREIRTADVLSGALLASAVERAKHAAAERHLRGEGGVAVEDVLGALDDALAAEAEKLASPIAARRILDFREAEEITHVELPARRPRRYRHLRAA